MSISGIGSNVIRDYSAVYGSKAAASCPRPGEAKEAVADKASKTYRGQDAVPVYAERVQQTDEFPYGGQRIKRIGYARTYHKGAWAAPNDRGVAIQNFLRRMIIMAMEITNNYSSYVASYTDTTKKTDSKAASEVKTNTSTNSKDKVQAYYEKLCKKFPNITFNTGSGLMSGNENKVVINLSSECLKKMANDPEFAKKVEFNLTGAVPGQNRMFAQAKADNAVIHGVTTVIDADGNASVTCGGMTRTSGSKQNSTTLNTEKKQKERLEKKREERKILEEKATKRQAEKRAEKKEQMEKLIEDRGADTFTVTATDTDVKSVTQNLIAAISGTSVSTGAGFDIKA